MASTRTVRSIYSSVNSITFSKFVARCKAENISIGDALSGFVEAYANGAVLVDGDRQTIPEHRKWDKEKEL